MTATLGELGLTPAQSNEIEALEPTYVDAWLDALAGAGGVKSPTGWFLAGIRSGRLPGEGADADRGRAVRLASTWIRNAGLYEPDEASLLEALFGDGGRLKPWADDETLRAETVALWRAEAPRGVQADREQTERADAWKRAQAKLEAAGVARLEQPEGVDA